MRLFPHLDPLLCDEGLNRLWGQHCTSRLDSYLARAIRDSFYTQDQEKGYTDYPFLDEVDNKKADTEPADGPGHMASEPSPGR